MDDYILRRSAYSIFNGEHNLYTWDEIEEAIDAIPAADVRPVRGGEWRYKTMTVPGGKGQIYAKWCCSKCKSKFKDRSKFCPNCGAKMGGTP